MSVFLFKLPSSTYNLPLQFRIDMAKKPATNTSSTKENPKPRSTATRPTLASKPLRTQTSSSNGAKDAETIAALRG